MKRILEAVNAVILLLMLLITVGQILFRSFLRISASWSEELAMYCFAGIVFVGAVSLTGEDAHITITAFIDRLSPGALRWFRVAGRLITLPFLVLFTWGAFLNTSATIGTSLPTVEWMKIGYMYLVLFVSGVLMIGYLVANTVRDVVGRAARPAARKPAAPGPVAKEGTV